MPGKLTIDRSSRGAMVPLLTIDQRRYEASWCGHRLKLQAGIYEFLELLAETPAEVVPYSCIYSRLWPNTIVEDGQMHFRASRLRQAIALQLVTSVPRRGFMLELPAEHVDIIPSSHPPQAV